MSSRSRGVVQAKGERRRMTVMFCDLVGSTELAERLDPEDVAEVLEAYYGAAEPIIEEHGGTVVSHAGDGIFAYFGYPVARDEDPHQAVRSGLALVRAIEDLAGRLPIRGIHTAARVSIHTGLLVVGGVATRRGAPEDVVGTTPNLAARLEKLGAPHQVVISDATYALVEGFFDVEALGAHELKGISRKVEVYRVLDETDARSRLDVRRTVPLRGRQDELSALLSTHEPDPAKPTPVVVVVGEPGVGKSRLLREFAARAALSERAWLEAHCSSHQTTTAYWPFFDLLTRVLEVTPDVAPSELAPVFGAVSADQAAGVLPEIARERCAHALMQMIQDHVDGRRCALVVEDVHWADPSSIDLIGRIARSRPPNITLMLSSRHGTATEVNLGDEAITLQLGRLSDDHMRDIVHAVAQRELDDDVAAQIASRAEGVPLYAEELCRATFATEDGGAVIPATLHDGIMSRLDRLGETKLTAQACAVIGRRFWPDILPEVTGLDGELVLDHLGHLVDAKMIDREPGRREAYQFHHALTRDAAYDSLVRKTRQDLHRRVGDALAARPALREGEPELIAHHYTNSAEPTRAIEFWMQASTRAGSRWAYAEARSHVEAALRLVDELPDSAERDRLEEQLRIALAVAAIRVRHSGADVEPALRRAAELARARGSRSSRALIHCLLVPHLQAVGRFGEALQQAVLAREALAGRESQLLPHVLGVEGATLVWQGRFAEGTERLERSRAAYLSQGGRATAGLGEFAVNTMFIGSCALLGFAYLLVGDDERGHAHCTEARSMADEMGAPRPRLIPRQSTAIAYQLTGALPELGELLVEVERIVGEERLLPAWALALRGWLRTVHGDDGEADLRAALGTLDADGQLERRPYVLGLLADHLVRRGRTSEAVRTVEEAIELADRTGERFDRSQMERIRDAVCVRP